MRITAIIPCRYASKRLDGKPLISIMGKPMIQWVFERVKGAALPADVVVATDDDRIYRCVEGFGGKALMTGTGHRCGSERVAEAAEGLGLKDEDIVINIQGDQPAMDARCLVQVVSPLQNEPDLAMATLARKMDDPAEAMNPNRVKCVFDRDNYALYFSRSPIPFNRDDPASPIMYKHLGIYAFRKVFLDRFCSLPPGRLENIEKLEQLRALEQGYRIKIVVTEYDSKAVDSAEDVAGIEALLSAEERRA